MYAQQIPLPRRRRQFGDHETGIPRIVRALVIVPEELGEDQATLAGQRFETLQFQKLEPDRQSQGLFS